MVLLGNQSEWWGLQWILEYHHIAALVVTFIPGVQGYGESSEIIGKYIIPTVIVLLCLIAFIAIGCFFYCRNSDNQNQTFLDRFMNGLCYCCPQHMRNNREHQCLKGYDDLKGHDGPYKISITTNTPTMSKQCPGCSTSHCHKSSDNTYIDGISSGGKSIEETSMVNPSLPRCCDRCSEKCQCQEPD